MVTYTILPTVFVSLSVLGKVDDPSIRKRPWTAEEDVSLADAVIEKTSGNCPPPWMEVSRSYHPSLFIFFRYIFMGFLLNIHLAPRPLTLIYPNCLLFLYELLLSWLSE